MPAARPDAPAAPLAFVGGDPSLDLVNTVDWTDRGPVQERLPDYLALLGWAVGAGVLDGATATRLRRAAENHPREADAAHAMALRVRALLRDLMGGGPR